MKKFIGITAIVTFVSFCCAVVSFFLLDIQKFIKYLDNSERVYMEFGFRDPIFAFNLLNFLNIPDKYYIGESFEERMERLGEKLEEKAEHFTTTFEEKLEEKTEDFTDFVEEQVEKKIENLTDGIEESSYYFADNIEHNINHIVENYLNNNIENIIDFNLNFFGIKDGYMDKADILRNTHYYEMSYERKQRIEQVKSIKIELKNSDIILAKSKGKEIETFLLKKKNSSSPAKLNLNLENQTMFLELNNNRKNNSLVYLLIPDNLRSDISISSKNGDIVSMNQKNSLSILSEDSDVIISQKESNNLTVKSNDGDIIVSLGKHPNAKINAVTRNGAIIGLGKITGNNSHNTIEKMRGEGKYKIDLIADEGSIIIN